jgi:glucose-1-phosphate cytidylyltransferase
MKAVILAGGLGTRLAEQTEVRPKPMVEIGGRPILWHLLKYYSSFGIDDFVICCGYRGYMIKEYFANYFLHMSDVTFDMAANEMRVHERHVEPWRVTLVDTGDATQTGGRLKRIADHVADEPAFCMTYGDGLSNVDIAASIAFHAQEGRLATVTAVHPPGRYGTILQEPDAPGKVAAFEEKPPGDGNLINGGFFVLSPDVLDWIDGDATIWEREPMQRLAAAGQLSAFVHEGFWQPMDTLRERNQLEDLWASGTPPWRRW